MIFGTILCSSLVLQTYEPSSFKHIFLYTANKAPSVVVIIYFILKSCKAYCIIITVFDKLIWCTIGPKSFFLALHSSLFGPDGAVNY